MEYEDVRKLCGAYGDAEIDACHISAIQFVIQTDQAADAQVDEQKWQQRGCQEHAPPPFGAAGAALFELGKTDRKDARIKKEPKPQASGVELNMGEKK
jgi:hypothetical protein